MANVTYIPAKKQIGSTAKPQEIKKLRVAAYARVSTDREEQLTSYEAQISYYTEYIAKKPEWECAGIFADEGISATSTKNRTQFNLMIEACMDGKIDMIITKSISRFARNTVDCLNYIRMLKSKNIPVFFEKENINTMDSRGEVMLTIMASLAQQESESLSRNTQMGVQYRFQQGKVIVNTESFLGYDKDEEGNLIINPEQAEVVMRIFREYLEGASYKKIAAGLERDGILTGRGNARWHDGAVRKILMNEKYMGDALLQKTVTVDFLKKLRVINTGIAPQYYVEDDHEAIIPKEIFMKVQEEMLRRRSGEKRASGKRRGYSANHAFSQIVYCAECGEQFRRIHWNNRGKKSVVWRCINRLEKSGVNCRARTVHEEILQEAVMQAVNILLSEKSDYLKILEESAALISVHPETEESDETELLLNTLQGKLVAHVGNRKEYIKIAEEILRLREIRQETMKDTRIKEEQLQKIQELQSFIHRHSGKMECFDAELSKKLIQKIEVCDDHLEILFRSGVMITVQA